MARALADHTPRTIICPRCIATIAKIDDAMETAKNPTDELIDWLGSVPAEWPDFASNPEAKPFLSHPLMTS
eukprot:gene2726-3369_t